uniref:Uncharacterized protein n=1 Tax=Pipistrellus kuhlii TaxID=59472 RepID=A0A7J7Y978_PIPKU|nr:hypothetical protein mPipKuh1_010263 [Pipistrellus kuhlii]
MNEPGLACRRLGEHSRRAQLSYCCHPRLANSQPFNEIGNPCSIFKLNFGLTLAHMNIWISMLQGQYIAPCAQHPKSTFSGCHILGSPSPSTLFPLPSGNHCTTVCVHEFQFYIPHMSEIIWFLALFD